MGCHFFLQGIFLTQGSDPPLLHLLHRQVGSLPPEPPGKPSLLLQFNSVAQSCPSLCNPWTAAHQTPLSFTISQSLRKLMSVESEIPSNHLILCRPLLNLPSIFPSICHHPHVTSGKTLTLTRRPLLASLLSSSNSIPLHPQS